MQLLLRQRLKQDISLWASTSPPSEDAIADFRKQLAAITERLEKQKNEIVEVHTIDPVLQATLTGSIENLKTRIETLEKKQLEKGDVFVVFLQLLGGLGVLSAVVFGIAKFGK